MSSEDQSAAAEPAVRPGSAGNGQTGSRAPATEAGPTTCLACRGTGQVISGLGGDPHPVTCPWCQGSGRRIPGIDAQQAPAEAASPAEVGSPAGR